MSYFRKIITPIISSIPLIAAVAWFQYFNIWHNKFDSAGFIYLFATFLRIIFAGYLATLAFLFGKRVVHSLGGLEFLSRLGRADRFVMASFVGISVISLGIYVLALAGFLHRNLIILILSFICIWLYNDFAISFAKALADFRLMWSRKKLSARHLPEILMAIIALMLFLYLFAWKGVVGSLVLHDVIAHYYPYFEYVANKGNLNPSQWYWQFFTLKGASLHHLAALLIDVQAIQLIGFYFFSLLAMLLMLAVQKTTGEISFVLLAAIILLALEEVHSAEFQKLHFFISAYIVFSLYLGAAFSIARDADLKIINAIQTIVLCAMVSMQPVSIVFAGLLFFVQAVTQLYYGQFKKLLYPVFAMSCVTAVLAGTLVFNYSKTGLFEIFPILTFMKYGDPSKYLNFISPIDAVFLQDYEGNNIASGFYYYGSLISEQGILPGMLAIAKGMFPLRSVAVFLTVIATMYGVHRYGAREHFFRKFALVSILYILFSFAWLLSGGSERGWNPLLMLMGGNIVTQTGGYVVAIVMAILLVFREFKRNWADSLFLASIVFIMSTWLVVTALSAGSIGRYLGFVAFFKPFFYVVLLFYVIYLIEFGLSFILRSGSTIIVKQAMHVALGLCVFFPLYQFIESYNRRAHQDIFVIPYFEGKLSYSNLYTYFGATLAVEIEHVVGKNRVIVFLNQGSGSSGMPNSRIQHSFFNLYADKRQTVWYGAANEAANLLKQRGIEYIYVDTNNELFIDAFSPLFTPGVIERYFKIIWSANGRYILAWSNSDQGIDSKEFSEKYSARHQADRNSSKSLWFPFYDRVRNDVDKLSWLPGNWRDFHNEQGQAGIPASLK